MDHANSLNCVKDVSILPASFSLHSVDFLPINDEKMDNSPKFCCVTLRNISNGHLYSQDFRSESEIRVLHGNSEAHNCIKEVLTGVREDETGSGEAPIQLANPDGIWTVPFRIPIKETKTTIQGMCWILERLIQTGWEINTSCLTVVNTGYDASSYFLKKNSAPALHNAQVAAVIVDEHHGKVEILSHRRGEKHVDINNAVHRAVKKIANPSGTPGSKTRTTPSSSNGGRCSSDFAKEIEAELRKSLENIADADDNEKDVDKNLPKKTRDLPPVIKKFAKPMYNKKARDDPKCPSEFKFDPLQISKEEGSEPKTDNKILCSRLVLEIAHLLFCRQWKLICHSSLPYQKSQMEVFYFCRDGRILPALGQQSFVMIDLEQPNKMRLFNMDESIRDALKSAVVKTQPHLEQISECEEFTEFKWNRPVWNHTLDEDEPKESLWIKESLAMATICNILVVMNRNELNLYGVSRLASRTSNEIPQKRCQMIFRQSNVAYSRSLCLHLSGTNKVILIGANQQEIEVTRNILKNRWPYPCSRDQELILDDKNKAWLFKLKRHPWAVSYGHKHLDRAAEIAQSLLHKPIAPPKNTDADSGKSILIFLLRAFSDEGWRVQASLDIASVQKGSFRQTHPWSFFLMR